MLVEEEIWRQRPDLNVSDGSISLAQATAVSSAT